MRARQRERGTREREMVREDKGEREIMREGENVVGSGLGERS